MSFAADVEAAVQRRKDLVDLGVRKIVIDVGAALVRKSPVGNPSLWKSKPPAGYVGGRFRNNWTCQVGSYTSWTTEAPDASGEGSNTRIAAAIPDKAGGVVYYISNSLPYAQALERGHSTQAPAGFVATTVLEFQQLADRVFKGLTV